METIENQILGILNERNLTKRLETLPWIPSSHTLYTVTCNSSDLSVAISGTQYHWTEEVALFVSPDAQAVINVFQPED